MKASIFWVPSLCRVVQAVPIGSTISIFLRYSNTLRFRFLKS
ncbi:hypothetical protein RchiOBHm_Chr3g0458301 [Rosa chinensis]|uniref:Uncharacterized protein n=1 Tax=Rosa chinensis TaxID=74649 RepID=A0A2P6R7V7_ROSCH|nr:hypothetical protein RchiOBHm_Chr3g0458301 [Rosa chinensis]